DVPDTGGPPIGVPAPFERGRRGAEAGHGMPAAGVAEDGVGGGAEEQACDPGERRRDQPSRSVSIACARFCSCSCRAWLAIRCRLHGHFSPEPVALRQALHLPNRSGTCAASNRRHTPGMPAITSAIGTAAPSSPSWSPTIVPLAPHIAPAPFPERIRPSLSAPVSPRALPCVRI